MPREIENLRRQLAALEDRVSRLEAAGPAGGASPAPPVDPLKPSTYVRRLAADGNTIEAIHEYRRETGVGLHEAKARIENLDS